VPRVLLARFQRESLPFLPWEGVAGDPPSEGIESEGEPCDFEAIIHGKKTTVPPTDTIFSCERKNNINLYISGSLDMSWLASPQKLLREAACA